MIPGPATDPEQELRLRVLQSGSRPQQHADATQDELPSSVSATYIQKSVQAQTEDAIIFVHWSIVREANKHTTSEDFRPREQDKEG